MLTMICCHSQTCREHTFRFQNVGQSHPRQKWTEPKLRSSSAWSLVKERTRLRYSLTQPDSLSERESGLTPLLPPRLNSAKNNTWCNSMDNLWLGGAHGTWNYKHAHNYAFLYTVSGKQSLAFKVTYYFSSSCHRDSESWYFWSQALSLFLYNSECAGNAC